MREDRVNVLMHVYTCRMCWLVSSLSSPLQGYLKHSHTQNSINVDCMVVYYLNNYTLAGFAIAVIFHPFGDTLKPFSVGKVCMGDCHACIKRSYLLECQHQ